MLVEFGKANYLKKARQQPEKVRQVLDKVRLEGLLPTVNAVRNKLDTPLPLGYCHVGIVEEVGPGVSAFSKGDRVVSNGSHAEFVAVSENLVARIPDGVSDEEAAFTVIGSIGLQGIRLLAPTFGETVVVYGLGLIGLLTARLLLANGCRVIGIDIDPAKLDIAARDGILPLRGGAGTDLANAVREETQGVGADGVIITASAKLDSIITDAAQMSRKRGRIVLVGVIPLNISRADFYTKELSFQVSCSYGPGRYDEAYEGQGLDYPIGFVRWTEQRNFQAILQAIATRRLKVADLITQRTPFAAFDAIYSDMNANGQIASLLIYDTDPREAQVRSVDTPGVETSFSESAPGIAIIGAGNFTSATMLPALARANAPLAAIVSRGGLSAATLAQKYGIRRASTDYAEVLSDSGVGLVAITTRHDLHARMVIQALEAGKHVFVEKPLALTNEDLDAIIAARTASERTLTVGFNRRFSPHAQAIYKRLPAGGAKNIVATMNAGHIPPEVWVHDLAVGGGRIIGEACHFIDLISYFTDSSVVAVCAASQGVQPSANTDNVSLLLRYANGDLGTINYFANGSKAYSKERVEVYTQNTTAVLDNFRRTDWYGYPGKSSLKTALDKGHRRQFGLLVERLASGGEPLIRFSSLINTSRAAIAAVESIQTRAWVEVAS